MEWLTADRWSPYAVGIGIGVLSWLTFILSDKPIGCSTAFSRAGGMIEKLFGGKRVLDKAYYQKIVPEVDWQVMLVIGVIIGAFISAKLGGTFSAEWVPATWSQTFGDSTVLRLAVALGGGVLMGLGSRWAGGCTSGHGISGSLQLAVSGWLAAMGFFAGGIAMAMIIYKLIGGA